MKVFVSHAAKDASLAIALTEQLSAAGIEAWNPYEEISPGENWAMRIGEALEDTDLMVFLVTPGAFLSDSLRHDVDYALASRRFQGRLITVVVATTIEMTKEVPWILLRQPHLFMESGSTDFSDVVRKVQEVVREPLSR